MTSGWLGPDKGQEEDLKLICELWKSQSKETNNSRVSGSKLWTNMDRHGKGWIPAAER